MGSNPAGANGCLFVVSVVCCQVEVSESDLSVIQRSVSECVVSMSVNAETRNGRP